MRFWRISNYANLTGGGGIFRSSRWNEAGQAVVYLADHPSTALLEVIVHIDREDAPVSYQLLAIECPDSLPVTEFDLPKDWENDEAATQSLGTEFLKTGASAVVRIPSVAMPQASNYLLNPAHPEAARIRITQTWRYPFDSRLLI
jgi:RES domain-containing protein